MSIITDLKEQFKSSYVEVIHFKSNQQDSSEFLEHGMPFPLTLSHHNEGYYISWALDGYSGTRTGKEYKFDTIDKISRALKAEVLPYLPRTNELYHPHISNYHEFNGIEIANDSKWYERDIVEQGSDKDLLFDYCRFDVYELKAKGLLYYDRVFDILEQANSRLGFNKPISDIKAKAKNMHNWTEENYVGGAKSRQEINADYYKKDKEIIFFVKTFKQSSISCKLLPYNKIRKALG